MVHSPQRGFLARWLLPPEVSLIALPLLFARALRALADGYMAVLLPTSLLSMGLSTLQVGIIATATMLGSCFATLSVGAWGSVLPRSIYCEARRC